MKTTGRLLTLLVAAALAVQASPQLTGAPRIRLHTINVGQGSATLLEARCGVVLVDTGSGENRADYLVEYLDRFFELRPDLDRTIEAVYVTHSHIDHVRGLLEVVEQFTVNRVVTNGRYGSSGGNAFNAFFDHIATMTNPPTIVEVTDLQVVAAGTGGFTNGDIDPLECEDCDPDLRVFHGGMDDNPGWSAEAFNNANNHSLVLRTKLESTAWLVTGDLEEKGIEQVLERYDGTQSLRATVLTIGHHGSRNATTQEFLDAVKPRYALISCGKWNEGQGTSNPFTTWRYGHPNRDMLELLRTALTSSRTAKTIKAGTASQTFVNYTVRKGIYCTAWDGSLVTDAYASGITRTRKSGID